MIKEKWIEKCSQPGAKGQAAIKEFEKRWKQLEITKYIPFVGWLLYFIYTKFLIPTVEELEEGLRNR